MIRELEEINTENEIKKQNKKQKIEVSLIKQKNKIEEERFFKINSEIDNKSRVYNFDDYFNFDQEKETLKTIMNNDKILSEKKNEENKILLEKNKEEKNKKEKNNEKKNKTLKINEKNDEKKTDNNNIEQNNQNQKQDKNKKQDNNKKNEIKETIKVIMNKVYELNKSIINHHCYHIRNELNFNYNTALINFKKEYYYILNNYGLDSTWFSFNELIRFINLAIVECKKEIEKNVKNIEKETERVKQIQLKNNTYLEKEIKNFDETIQYLNETIQNFEETIQLINNNNKKYIII